VEERIVPEALVGESCISIDGGDSDELFELMGAMIGIDDKDTGEGLMESYSRLLLLLPAESAAMMSGVEFIFRLRSVQKRK
jgi:hypothetical protein